MNREHDTVAKKQEKNPFVENNKIQKHFILSYSQNSNRNRLRNKTYIPYRTRIMPGTFYSKGIEAFPVCKR